MNKKIILLGGTINSGKNMAHDLIKHELGADNVHSEYLTTY